MSPLYILFALVLIAGQTVEAAPPNNLFDDIVYSGQLFGECKVGQVFVISGITTANASIVRITLSSDLSENQDVPLRMRIDFSKNQIFRYHRLSNTWSAEDSNYNPIRRGEPFKVYILVGPDRFDVAINDRSYCSYKLHMPLASVRTVRVQHDVQAVFQADHRTTFPVPFPQVLRDIDPGRIDFSGDIPRRFRPGHQIDIVGVPLAAANGQQAGQFVLGLFEDSNKPVFQFSPHFGPAGNRVVIKSANTLCAPAEKPGGDGKTDVVAGSQAFPFAIGEEFRLTLVMWEDELEFRVNGALFERYQFRCAVAFSRLAGLRVQGREGMRVRIASVDHRASEL